MSRLVTNSLGLSQSLHSCVALHTCARPLARKQCHIKRLSLREFLGRTAVTQEKSLGFHQHVNYSRWHPVCANASFSKLKVHHRYYSAYHRNCFYANMGRNNPETYSVKRILSVKPISCLSMDFTRNYHLPSKFTIQNPVYVSYLDSLLEEYKTMSSTDQDHPNKDSKDQQQILRFNFLKSVAEVIEMLQAKQKEIQELSDMMEGEEDKEMRNLMEKEQENLMTDVQEIETELVDVLVGDELADSNDIILEVAAGVGGQEAMLFCAELLDMYCHYALYKGWNVTGINSDTSELGGSRRSVVEISGEDVYQHLKHEAGVHRVQRIPKTEKAGRIHTSTVSVSVQPQPKEIDVDIQQKDLKIDTFRGTGAGGQSVNTTDSSVRITHIPTGTVVECKEERSQIANREKAMKYLKNRIYQSILEEQELKRQSTRKMHMGTRSRSEKIRTYNFQQDRITDHRLKENCSNIGDFMIGGEGLDDLVNSLNEFDKLQTLESMLDEYASELSKKKSGKR